MALSAEATIRKIWVGARRRLKELHANKGYDSAALRRCLRKRGIVPNIPERQYKHRGNWARSQGTTWPKAGSGHSWNAPMLGSSTLENYAPAGMQDMLVSGFCRPDLPAHRS